MTKVRIVGAVLAVLVPLTASQVALAGLGAQAKRRFTAETCQRDEEDTGGRDRRLDGPGRALS